MWKIANTLGMTATIAPIGAAIQSLLVSDRHGNVRDVVLGYERAEDYANNPVYLGCAIGRLAGRVGPGKVWLDGEAWEPTLNEEHAQLHGGDDGVHQAVWRCRSHTSDEIVLETESPDGAGGYPGTLQITSTYRIGDENRLEVAFTARTDRTTFVNLTQHSYFNLAGHAAGSIRDHVLHIPSRFSLVDDEHYVATGEICRHAGQDFDFRVPRPIGERMGAAGYNLHYVVEHRQQGDLSLAAAVTAPDSSLRLEAWTNQPGMEFYTGQFLDAAPTGKNATKYSAYAGFCLETQNFPNAPHCPHFPSSLIRPGETYSARTEYRFS